MQYDVQYDEPIKVNLGIGKKVLIWTVVVAQLAERLLPIPEDPGSNPVNGNFY